MKFLCQECGESFMYTAKKTVSKNFPSIIPNDFMYETVETQTCPYCDTLNFTEAPAESTENPEIIALKDSPLADVNAWITEGYKIMPDKIYAKSAVLVKYAAPKLTPEQKSVEAIHELFEGIPNSTLAEAEAK